MLLFDVFGRTLIISEAESQMDKKKKIVLEDWISLKQGSTLENAEEHAGAFFMIAKDLNKICTYLLTAIP